MLLAGVSDLRDPVPNVGDHSAGFGEAAVESDVDRAAQMSGREIVHAPCIHHAHTVFERRTNRGSSRVPRRCLATPLNSQFQGYSRPVSAQRNHIRRERVAADDRSARHVGADPAQIQDRPRRYPDWPVIALWAKDIAVQLKVQAPAEPERQSGPTVVL